MRNPLGIIIIMTGIVLLAFGISATDSFSSSVSRFFTGAPTDRSIWLMIGGVIVTAIGAGITASGWTKSG